MSTTLKTVYTWFTHLHPQPRLLSEPQVHIYNSYLTLHLSDVFRVPQSQHIWKGTHEYPTKTGSVPGTVSQLTTLESSLTSLSFTPSPNTCYHWVLTFFFYSLNVSQTCISLPPSLSCEVCCPQLWLEYALKIHLCPVMAWYLLMLNNVPGYKCITVYL